MAYENYLYKMLGKISEYIDEFFVLLGDNHVIFIYLL